MRFLKTSLSAITALSNAVCAISLVLIILLVFAEIVARNVFQTSTYAQVEVSGYLIAIFTVFGAAVGIGSGKALAITLLTQLAAVRRVSRIVTPLRFLIGAGVIAFAAWYFYLNTLRDFSRGNTSGTLINVPIWIPEAVVTIGFVACLAVAVLRAFVAEDDSMAADSE